MAAGPGQAQRDAPLPAPGPPRTARRSEVRRAGVRRPEVRRSEVRRPEVRRPGTLLLALTTLTLALTAAWPSAGVLPGPALALTGLALPATLGCALAPWSRLPRRYDPAPLLAVLGLLTALGAWAGGLSHAVLLFAGIGLYAGVTLPAGSYRWLLPTAVLGALLALLGAEPAHTAPALLGGAVSAAAVAEVLARSLARSATATRGAETLLQAVTELHEAASEADAAELVADLAERLLQPDVTLVAVAPTPGAPVHVARAARGVDPERGPLVLDTASDTGIATALREGRALFVTDAARSPLLAGSSLEPLGLSTVLLVPVPGEGGYLGSLVVGWHGDRRALDPFSEQVVGLLSSQAGALLERLRNVGRLTAQASTDALTGLANRRTFLEALDRLRPGGAVVFLDLDHFKRLNDTQGHAAGDAALVEFAAALRASVRDDDCAARYGGEEFALVLPSAASVDMTDAALVVVERLRRRWAGPVTFSVGVAAHRLGDAPSTTLARADAAVYEAKARGRDTLVVAPELDERVPAPRSG